MKAKNEYELLFSTSDFTKPTLCLFVFFALMYCAFNVAFVCVCVCLREMDCCKCGCVCKYMCMLVCRAFVQAFSNFA